MINPKATIEAKIKEYLEAQTEITYPVQKGQTVDENLCPTIIVYAQNARTPADIPFGDGNFMINLRIMVITSAKDIEESSHYEQVQSVKDCLNDTDAIKALMDPATDGMIYDLWYEDDEEGKDGTDFGNNLTYTVAMVGPAGD